MGKNKFYVTTPIYYVTAAPHLGSLYSTLIADVLARYHKLIGAEVFFLTGTDEHGQKIAQAAQKADKPPKEFVDSFIEAYKNIWKLYNLDYSKFIRTTDDYHIVGVQKWIQHLMKKGDIYKNYYQGFYCTPCETFVPEKSKLDIEKNQQIKCPSCLRDTTIVSEECYFFRLSAYQEKLLQFYQEHPHFIMPKERAHEVIAFVKEGLHDLSISRRTVTWGIPFPGDHLHVTYVWADALNNYLTAVGYGDETKQEMFEKWWPADVQVLGKDIIRFHAVYWPAFLMASDLPLPKQLLVHGWIKVNDQKMSKSLGNTVSPTFLAQTYGVDAIRYYLIRKMAVTQDSEFRLSDIEQSINSELANDLGNLLNRCVTLAMNYNVSLVEVPNLWSKKSYELQQECRLMIKESWDLIEQGFLHRAVNRIWEFMNKVNAYFHEQEPWHQSKRDKVAFRETIAATVYSLQAIGIMLWPIMPEKMELLLASLGFEWEKGENIIILLEKTLWNKNAEIKKIDMLFQKIEQIDQSEMKEQKVVKNEQDNTTQGNGMHLNESFDISIEEFLKVQMRVGTILTCEEVQGSDKLLKMQVDFGEFGRRQILSGIKKYYQPTDLINKQGIFVVNLKPRKMMGMESHGMMLTASNNQGLKMLIPSQHVAQGAKIS
ncbi:methionine--tRNA ligase [Candidatus Dependentiae bacterium]|nr:methionine--tRNA ligase [Candidatus Dependentiae bacterium]